MNSHVNNIDSDIKSKRTLQGGWCAMISLIMASLVKDHKMKPRDVMLLLAKTDKTQFAAILNMCYEIVVPYRLDNADTGESDL